MQKRQFFGAMFAASFAISAIAGCQVPMQSSVPGATGPQYGAAPATVQPASALIREGAALALAEERQLADYDVMAGQATGATRYAIFSTEEAAAEEGDEAEDAEEGEEAEEAEEAEDAPEAQATTKRAEARGKMREDVRQKVKERQAKHAEKIQKRLEKQKEAAEKIREKMKGAWVDNGDGTESKSFSFSMSKTVNGKTMSHSVEMKRTRNAETKDLISASTKSSQTLPNGMSKSSERTTTVNADGTFTVVFHSEHTFKDGTKRVADFSKTVAVDGAVAGTGTIVWTDKDGNEVKKVAVTLGGNEEETQAEAGGETVTPDEAPAEEAPAEEPAATDEAAAPEEAPAEEASSEVAPAEDTADGDQPEESAEAPAEEAPASDA